MVPFAAPKKHYTRSFERYALELSAQMTIKDVANHLAVSWDVIKDIQSRSLQRRFGKPKLHKLKQIAIDEINIGKGHRYLTIVLDLLSGAVVFVGDGKGVDALQPFWKLLRRAHTTIERPWPRTCPQPISVPCVKTSNACGPCLRSFPRHQAVQRKALRPSVGGCSTS